MATKNIATGALRRRQCRVQASRSSATRCGRRHPMLPTCTTRAAIRLLRQLGLERGERIVESRRGKRPRAQCLRRLAGQKKGAAGCPVAPNSCLAGPGLRAPRCQALSRKLSGRSQRGDSAWDKTLDHLLSLVSGDLSISGDSATVKARPDGSGRERQPVTKRRGSAQGGLRPPRGRASRSVRCGCSSMVEQQPSKLNTRVRFPSPAPSDFNGLILARGDRAMAMRRALRRSMRLTGPISTATMCSLTSSPRHWPSAQPRCL